MVDRMFGQQVCHECGSENIVEKDTYIVYEDCGVEKDICPSKKRGSICLEHIQASVRYPKTKILQFKEYNRVYQGNLFARITPNLIDTVKQKLLESPSKKDVLKVLKSDSELKDFSNAVHAIYYKITANSPVDFRHDEYDFLFDIRCLLKFYHENKPERNNFKFRYVLYYLLKQKNYPVTLEDFPEIRGFTFTKKLCDDFFLSTQPPLL